MMKPLPARRTHTFQAGFLSLIPKKNRQNLIFDLSNISKEDLKRYPNLKGPLLRPFRSYHKRNFRILFVYCFQCYKEFDHRVNCNGCDKEDLERLILINIEHRSNAYRFNQKDLSNFTLF